MMPADRSGMPAMAGEDDEAVHVRKMIEAARDGAGQSSLYRWFWRHFDVLDPEFRRPNWQGVADKANELGLRAVGGRPVTKDSARQTFAKVRKAKGATAGRDVRKADPGTAAPAKGVSPAPGGASAPLAEVPRTKFGVAGLRRTEPEEDGS
jgi:hypothetical protein